MSDIRQWKKQMEDFFGEKSPHYSDVDILSEMDAHRVKGQKDRDDSWGTDPEMQIYITADSKEAEEKSTIKAGRGNGPKDSDQELINMSRGYFVNIHKDFERYTNPDKYEKKTDGAKSILPENKHTKIDLDADSVKPKEDRPKHDSLSPKEIRSNFKKMAKKLNVDFVDDFDGYTEVKPKVSDGEKSILPEGSMRKLLQVMEGLYENKDNDPYKKEIEADLEFQRWLDEIPDEAFRDPMVVASLDDLAAELDDLVKSEELSENVSEKSKSIIDGWISSEGHRGTAVKLVDHMLNAMIGVSSSDLPDTLTFADGLDEIEELLSDENYRQALVVARDVAYDMIKNERLDISESEMPVQWKGKNQYEIQTPYGVFTVSQGLEGEMELQGRVRGYFLENSIDGKTRHVDVDLRLVIMEPDGTLVDDDIVADEYDVRSLASELAERVYAEENPNAEEEAEEDEDQYWDNIRDYEEDCYESIWLDEQRVMSEVVRPLIQFVVTNFGSSLDDIETRRSAPRDSLLDLSESQLTVTSIDDGYRTAFQVKTPYGDVDISKSDHGDGLFVQAEIRGDYFKDYTTGTYNDIKVYINFVIDSDGSVSNRHRMIVPDEDHQREIVSDLAHDKFINEYPDVDIESDEYLNGIEQYEEFYYDNTGTDRDKIINEIIEPLAEFIVKELGTSFDELEARRSGTQDSLLDISEEEDEEQGGYDVFMSAEEAEEIVRDYTDMHGDSFEDGLKSMRMQYEHDGDLDRNERVAYEIYTGKIKPFDMDKLIGEDEEKTYEEGEVTPVDIESIFPLVLEKLEDEVESLSDKVNVRFDEYDHVEQAIEEIKEYLDREITPMRPTQTGEELLDEFVSMIVDGDLEFDFTDPDSIADEINTALYYDRIDAMENIDGGETMRKVRIMFDNNDVIHTNVSADMSDEDIRDYYAIGKEFNIGDGEKDKMVSVAKVDIDGEISEIGPAAGALLRTAATAAGTTAGNTLGNRLADKYLDDDLDGYLEVEEADLNNGYGDHHVADDEEINGFPQRAHSSKVKKRKYGLRGDNILDEGYERLEKKYKEFFKK